MDKQPKAFEVLRNAINDLRISDDLYEEEQRKRFKLFLEGLRNSQLEADNFALIIIGAHFGGDSGASGRAPVQSDSAQLYAVLSEAEKKLLKEHFLETLGTLKLRFPDLVNEFPEQFKRRAAAQA
jgi:hypothetical protein